MRFFLIPYHMAPLLYDFNTHTQRPVDGIAAGSAEAVQLNETEDQEGTTVLEGFTPRIYPGRTE